MKKHILFLGLNDKDSKMQEISTLDAYKITMATIKKYYDGYKFNGNQKIGIPTKTVNPL